MVSEQADKEFDLATGVEVAGTDEAAVEPADHEGQVSATSGQLGAAVTDNGKEDAGSRPVSGAPSIQEPRDGDPDIRMMN